MSDATPARPTAANPATEWVFRLDDPGQGIARTLAAGVTTRIFPGDHAMLSVVRLEPGACGRMHSHPEEQWGVLLEGDCVRVQGGEEVRMRAGDFWRTPPNVPHTVRAGPRGAVILDVFSPPRDEYRKPGSGFGTAGENDRKTMG